MLRGATGTPMRITARANISFALAEPEPLTLAKRTTKSFTRLIDAAVGMKSLLESYRSGISACPSRPSGSPPPPAALIPDPDAAGLEAILDIQILGEIVRRRVQLLAQIRFFAVRGERNAIHRADIDASVAFDTKLRRKHGLNVAIQTTPGFREC